LNLQEAMFAGVPPVVFPKGGIIDAVCHQANGLIVHTEEEYVKAIEFLYEHPEQRRRMSQAARQFAMEHFGGERSAPKLHRAYQSLLRCPKRQHTWTAPEHRFRTAPNRSGAEFFLESLGCSQTPYHVSLYGQETEAVLAADEQIAKQTPLERVLLGTYREFYPDDVHLPYWLGLAWQKGGQHEQAAAEFSMARLDGPIAWRLDWRRAEAAARLGDLNRAAELCREVLLQVPGFTPARHLVSQHAQSPWCKQNA
jgi:Glycosyl transferases group 1